MQSVTPCFKIQQLTGVLYGVAGVAPFVDWCGTNSQLLQMHGGEPHVFHLPTEGQSLALL